MSIKRRCICIQCGRVTQSVNAICGYCLRYARKHGYDPQDGLEDGRWVPDRGGILRWVNNIDTVDLEDLEDAS